jgi:hypothetical protein
MSKTFRYTITVDEVKRSFLKLGEIPKGDLVIAKPGRRHEINLPSGDYFPIDYSITDQNVVTHGSVTVHHNPNSEIGSITVKRHRRVNRTDRPVQVAYL